MHQPAEGNGAKPAGKGPVYGPHNPHPLSQMRTELVWEGKYDEYGNRREVDVAGLSMPLQKIETIDQPRSEADAAGQLDMFERKTPRRDDLEQPPHLGRQQARHGLPAEGVHGESRPDLHRESLTAGRVAGR